MSDLFDKIRAGIEKNVKGAHTAILSESEIAKERFWVKTPALDLNRALSGDLYKGIQSRNLVGIIGPEHTMKSSFMVLCMAEAQKQGKEIIIIDTEGGITGDFCERWGLDPTKTLYNYTPFINEVKGILGQIRESGDDNLVIGLDSAGGLDRIKYFNDAGEGKIVADQGILQKEIRGMLKLFLNVCIKQNSIGIICGHMYGKPGSGPVPSPDQIGGGKAMKLFPSVLISLYKRPLKDGPTKDAAVIGSEITATTIKNRIYPPYQTATVKLNYIEGVQPYAGILDLCVTAHIVEQKGAWYSYKDERLGQGAVNATENLPEHPEILDELNIWLKKTGYSTVNKNVEEAEELLQEEESKED